MPAVAGIQIPDLVADLRVRFEDLVLLEVVPVLVDDRRAAVLHGPDSEVQIAPAPGALVEGLDTETIADPLFEAGMRVVAAAPDAAPRMNVPPLQAPPVGYALLLSRAA